MLPSMYSGISGLKANQKKLDVVGNNIANSGTTAFKSQRIRFQDMISQNIGQATMPGVNIGGTNPKQIGLGVQIAGIDTVTSNGSMQPTSRNLDAAIDGPGYFMVSRGPVAFGDGGLTLTGENMDTLPEDTNGQDIKYTRDGSFTLDSDGNLLTSDGYRVLGYGFGALAKDDTAGTDTAVGKGKATFIDANAQLPEAGPLGTLIIPDTVDVNGKATRVQSFSIEKNGVVKAVLQGGAVTVLGQIAMASFKNDGGLSKVGKNLYENTANSGKPVIRCGANIDVKDPKYNGGAYGDMLQGCLEMSNVDLAEQFTDMIIASRAFQANGKIISTGDEILQDLVNLKR